MKTQQATDKARGTRLRPAGVRGMKRTGKSGNCTKGLHYHCYQVWCECECHKKERGE